MKSVRKNRNPRYMYMYLTLLNHHLTGSYFTFRIPQKCISHISSVTIFDENLRLQERILSIIQKKAVDIGMLLRADIKFLREVGPAPL